MSFKVIRMNKCVMGDHDWTTATMSTGCAFAEDPDNTDEVVLTNGLEECGMELSFTDTSIVYTVCEHSNSRIHFFSTTFFFKNSVK